FSERISQAFRVGKTGQAPGSIRALPLVPAAAPIRHCTEIRTVDQVCSAGRRDGEAACSRAAHGSNRAGTRGDEVDSGTRVVGASEFSGCRTEVQHGRLKTAAAPNMVSHSCCAKG